MTEEAGNGQEVRKQRDRRIEMYQILKAERLAEKIRSEEHTSELQSQR